MIDALSPETVDRELSAARPGTQDLVLQRMLATWTDDDPLAAARYAELQTVPSLREVALRTVAQRWARIQPDDAASWAASLVDDEALQVTQDVALVIAEAQPQRALEVLSQRGNDEATNAARAGAITSWATRDFPAAQSWVEAQPASGSRDAIALRLAFLRAQSNPAAAARLASQMLEDDAARSEAYASIIGLWMRRDPEAARAWIASADTRFRSRLDAEIAISRAASPDD